MASPALPGITGDPGDIQVISRTLCATHSGGSGGAADSVLSLSTSEPSSEGSRLMAGLPEGLSFPAGFNGGGTKSCGHQTGQGSAVY